MKTVESGSSVRVGGRTLTILERTIIEHHHTRDVLFISARKEPYAVVVKGRDGEYTLSLDGGDATPAR